LHHLEFHPKTSRWRPWRPGAIPAILLLFSVFLTALARGADSGRTNEPAPRTLEPFATLTNSMGPWIWASNTSDSQTCQFWHTLEVPEFSSVTNARLVMTADDEFTLYLDGRELGRGVDWRELFVFDLTPLLTTWKHVTGKHVLAIRAFNSAHEAGVSFGLQVKLTDGRLIKIKSDKTWRVVPNSAKRWQTKARPAADWPAATIEAPLGVSPWMPWPVNVVGMPTLQPLHLVFWQTGWFQITLLVVCGLAILLSLRLMAQAALHRKERWLLHQERSRMAREIHDDIGSRMTQLVLHGEVAQCQLPAGSQARQQLIQLCEEARKLLATMDEILWAVNPQRDTLRDFAAHVCNYAQEFLKPTKIQCLFDVASETTPTVFNLPLRRSLFMAIKETLNNAVKYSEATELHLQIQWLGQWLVVVVQDNGKGFDPLTVRPGRHGMTNMRQRMNELGGSCLVTSEPGRGCRVEFSVPLKRPPTGLRAWIWDAKPFSSPISPPADKTSAPSNEPKQTDDPSRGPGRKAGQR
jgi:signal transduction histidine kinase